MDESEIQAGMKHLEEIEEDLDINRKRTGDPKRSFVSGLFQGAGAIVGSLIALAALGTILSFIGVIPVFADASHYLHTLIEERVR